MPSAMPKTKAEQHRASEQPRPASCGNPHTTLSAWVTSWDFPGHTCDPQVTGSSRVKKLLRSVVAQHPSGLATWHICSRGTLPRIPSIPNSRTRLWQSEYMRQVLVSCWVPCQKKRQAGSLRHRDSQTFCSMVSSADSNCTSMRYAMSQTICPFTSSNAGGTNLFPLFGGMTSRASGLTGGPSQPSGMQSQGWSQKSRGSAVPGSSRARGCTMISSPSPEAWEVTLGAGQEVVSSWPRVLVPLAAFLAKSFSRQT
mmetsp:Transcript_4099/g.9105  ORF Transcript_4099/g.9105 Transcript_4099/m.9105 type:complete len:255 (+) Transcript_4099:531-1295(+)